ncbi:MAG: hypothetical protein MUC62_00315 [Candidatus Thermoplasmatota archaeon]|jgi:uncharacterized coiled-coil DUF342 family protein|nr:hypothetical protein [Candidatus Thermoplasmatota archaeon]
MTGEESVDKVNGSERPDGPVSGNEGNEVVSGPSTVMPPADVPVDDGSRTRSNEDQPVGDEQADAPIEDSSAGPALETTSVVLPPIDDYGSDLVLPPQELSLPTRVDVMEQLIQKHRSMVEAFSKEKEGQEQVGQLPEEESDEEKARRDEVNKAVQTLKAERGSLRVRNKALSKELFQLLDKMDRLKDRSSEISSLQRYVSDLEWKIETEDIKIEQERKHLDEIKATMRKLREITDGFTPDEIMQRTSDIQEEIDQNLLRMEEAHRAMLEKVDESNLHHGKFMDAQKKAREVEARKQWLTRRVELHAEMGKFWEGQIDNARKLDSEETARPIGPLRDHLLSRMGERSAEKGHEGDQRSTEQQAPGTTEAAAKGQSDEHGPKGRVPRGRPRKKVGPVETDKVFSGPPEDTTPAKETDPPEGGAAPDRSTEPAPALEEAPHSEGQTGGGA